MSKLYHIAFKKAIYEVIIKLGVFNKIIRNVFTYYPYAAKRYLNTPDFSAQQTKRSVIICLQLFTLNVLHTAFVL